MNELDDALRRLRAIAGSDPERWDRIARFVKTHRPKLPGKRPGKPWGTIKDQFIKLDAIRASDDAPRGKKSAAEAAIYAKYGRKVSPELAAKNRQRMRKHLIEMLEKLDVEIEAKRDTDV